MDTVVARLVVVREGLKLGQDLAPLCLQPTSRFRLRGGTVLAVDATLATIASRPTALSPAARLLAATNDLRQIVAVENEQLVLVGDRTVRLPVPDADTATFLRTGRLLVTAPNIEHQTWGDHPHAQRTTHRVLLIDPRSGGILDETVLDGVFDAGVFAIAHPTDGSVLLDAAEGQDGSTLFAARIVGDEIRTELLGGNVVAGGFSPAGDRLLLMPHPSFEDQATVDSWPDLDQIGAASLDAVGIADDTLDLYGCFLDANRVLMKTVADRLLVGTGDLSALVPVTLSAPRLGERYRIGVILGLGPNLFAAELWHDTLPTATVWELPAS